MIQVTFLDSGREPTVKPNPDYPNGIDLDLRKPGEPYCGYNLPYPAPRCGAYMIECQKCGHRVAVTVAGRPDDPRTITLPCKGGSRGEGK